MHLGRDVLKFVKIEALRPNMPTLAPSSQYAVAFACYKGRDGVHGIKGKFAVRDRLVSQNYYAFMQFSLLSLERDQIGRKSWSRLRIFVSLVV